MELHLKMTLLVGVCHTLRNHSYLEEELQSSTL
jgi:hypothetical protein